MLRITGSREHTRHSASNVARALPARQVHVVMVFLRKSIVR
jgi:hypothetical protein